MKNQSILIRYHEIALKGENRGWFENQLEINTKKLIQRAVGDSTLVKVRRIHGRVIVETDWNETITDALKRVFGISNFSLMRSMETTKETILKTAIEELQTYVKKEGIPRTFRVKTRRSDKVFRETSMEIDRWVGTILKDLHPSMIVDLKNPDFTLGLELRFKESFLWTEKIQAEGGLPVGTNARVLSLMSGGLDSPVAAIQTLRRGSPTSFIHFYGAPFVGEEVLEKIEDLVRIVNRYQPDPQPLSIVHFGKIQEKIALATHPKMRTLLYRRMMIRIAEEVAHRLEAKALVTGESLGQVASQTVENLATINSVATLPIFRPLITYDKDEIITRAKKWGTFETSIRPATDCCTLFADRHPSLRTTIQCVEAEEGKFPVRTFVEEALESLVQKE